jgi:hypothetical protein
LAANACKSKPADERPPSGVLEKDKMVAVLADIHLAEAATAINRVEKDSEKLHTGMEYAKIMALHSVDFNHFKTSFDWYMEHPVLFDLLYDEVLELISQQEQHLPELDTKGHEAIDAETKKQQLDAEKRLKLEELRQRMMKGGKQ